jgi:hypothetical protein
MTSVKGIVLKASNNRATVLTDQGEFKEVKIHGFIQEGEVWQDSPMLMWKYACAAAVILMLLVGGIDFFSVSASAKISPGIELGLNRWDRVISVKALNNNGKQIIESLDLRGKKVEEAIEELTSKKLEKSNTKKPVITIVTKKSNNEKAEQRIKEKINSKIQGIIEKEQPSKKVKSKTKTSNDLGKYNENTQDKKSINNGEKTSSSYSPKPAQNNIIKGESDIQTNFFRPIPLKNNSKILKEKGSRVKN